MHSLKDFFKSFPRVIYAYGFTHCISSIQCFDLENQNKLPKSGNSVFCAILSKLFCKTFLMKFGNLTCVRAVGRNFYANNIVARAVGNAIVVSTTVASCQICLHVAVLVNHFSELHSMFIRFPPRLANLVTMT